MKDTKELSETMRRMSEYAVENYKKGYPPPPEVAAEYQALFSRFYKVGEKIGKWTPNESPEEYLKADLSDGEHKEMLEWEHKVIRLVKSKINCLDKDLMTN